MSLSLTVSSLATRIASEFKSVRAQIAEISLTPGPTGADGAQGIQGLPSGSIVEFKSLTTSAAYYPIKSDVGKIILMDSTGIQIVMRTGIFAVGDVLNFIQRSSTQNALIWNDGYSVPVISSGAATSNMPNIRAKGSAVAIICTPSTTPGDEFFVVGDIV